MVEETCKEERKIGLLSSVVCDLILALEKDGQVYIGDPFELDLGKHREVTPSKEKGWDWGKITTPIERPFRGQLIVFERSGGKIVGWCSVWEFKQSGFAIVRASAA